MSLEFVLASHNAKKVREFQRIIGERMPQAVVHEYDGPEPVEDGVTFAENALIKARRAAEHTGHVALADDSGIVVDVLGAAPGILSSRWAGHRADDRANVEWARAAWSDMKGFGTGGNYINFLTEDEGADRIEAALGGALRRLGQIKSRWDPQNLFRTNRNIKPTA